MGISEVRAARRKYQAKFYERELLDAGRSIAVIESTILDIEATLGKHREMLASLRDEARGWRAALAMLENEQALDAMDDPEPDAP